MNLVDQFPILISTISNGIEGQVNITDNSANFFRVVHGGDFSYNKWSIIKNNDESISIDLDSKILGEEKKLKWDFSVDENEYEMLSKIKSIVEG